MDGPAERLSDYLRDGGHSIDRRGAIQSAHSRFSCRQLPTDAVQRFGRVNSNYCCTSDKSYDRTGKLLMGLISAALYIPYC